MGKSFRLLWAVLAVLLLTAWGTLRGAEYVRSVKGMRQTIREQHSLIASLTNRTAALEAEKKALQEQIAEIEWGTRVVDSPDKLVTAFMEAYKNRSGTLARMYLTESARDKVPACPLGPANPFVSRYEILSPRQPVVDSDNVQFLVRVHEEYTGQGEIGYYDLTLTVVESEYRYLIEAIKQGQYVHLQREGSRSNQ
jgi:hypothetical protein